MEKISTRTLDSVSQVEWNTLSEKKIFFGHQSVGFNIIDGIKDVIQKNNRISLEIVETDDPADFNRPIFGHARAGENTKPNTKCDDFKKMLQSGIGDSVDIAFLKFCYVDMSQKFDEQEVFDYYKRTLSQLQALYPHLKFVHLTLPLKSNQAGLKGWVKSLIGSPLGNSVDNICRNRFNDLMRGEYEGQAPLFDLALYESTLPNGRRQVFVHQDTTYFSMAPQYTNDGGHLNESGRVWIAEQLLIFLTKLDEKG